MALQRRKQDAPAMLDAKMAQEKIEMPVDDGQDNGLEQPAATVFSFEIVK